MRRSGEFVRCLPLAVRSRPVPRQRRSVLPCLDRDGPDWPVWSAVRWEGLEVLEGLEDGAGPKPVGGEMQGDPGGVAGELRGHVQDPVAQPSRLADLLFAVEREELCPDHHVVRGEASSRHARRWGPNPWNWQVARARRLHRLESSLDLGVLTVRRVERGEGRGRSGRSCPSGSVTGGSAKTEGGTAVIGAVPAA